MIESGDLHLLCLCEGGGHRQGLRDARVHMDAGAAQPGESFSVGAYASCNDVKGADAAGVALQRQSTQEASGDRWRFSAWRRCTLF